MEIIDVGCEVGTKFACTIPINSSLKMVIIDIHLLLQIQNYFHTKRTNLPLQFLKQSQISHWKVLTHIKYRQTIYLKRDIRDSINSIISIIHLKSKTQFVHHKEHNSVHYKEKTVNSDYRNKSQFVHYKEHNSVHYKEKNG